MKLLLTLLTSLICTYCISQTYDWHGTIVPLTGSPKIVAATSDSLANLYTASIKTGSVEANFPPFSATFTSTYPQVATLINKIDSNGHLIWSKQLAGINGNVRVSDIEVSNEHGVIIVGHFSDSVDFDPGIGIALEVWDNNADDFFILKLDTHGVFQWVKTIQSNGITQGFSYAYDLDVEFGNDGSVFLTGNFVGTTDFDPGLGVNNLTAPFVPIFGQTANIFLLKLDYSGGFAWAQSYGDLNGETSSSIAITKQGDIILQGIFKGSVDFDLSPTQSFILTSTSVNYDIFILKLDSSGAFVWAKRVTSSVGSALPLSICTDIAGNIYTAGESFTTLDFDNGSPQGFLTMTGTSSKIFIAKFNSNGSFSWAEAIGGPEPCRLREIKVDLLGNTYLVGYFYGINYSSGYGPLDFNYSHPSNPQLVQGYSIDGFINKRGPDGSSLWAERIGTLATNNSHDYTHSIDIDHFGSIYATGSYKGNVDLDPGPLTNYTVSTPVYGEYVLRWKQCGFNVSEIDTTLCDQIVIGNQTVNSSGLYYDTSYVALCGNLTAVNVNILNSSDSHWVWQACDSFNFNGSNYYESQVVIDTFTNAAGCDSIHLIELTIDSSFEATQTISACMEYESESGAVYTSSGLYTEPFITVAGCDSIVLIDLTIDAIDITLTRIADTLYASQNESYQWINCDSNNSLITGANQQAFTPLTNGSYAVIVSNGSCTDTSNCLSIQNLGLRNHTKFDFSIYPNPNNGTMILISNSTMIGRAVVIKNSLGQIVKTQRIRSNQEEIKITNAPSGIYILSIPDAAYFKTIVVE